MATEGIGSLFASKAAKFLLKELPELKNAAGFSILGERPWSVDRFQAEVEMPDCTRQVITAYSYPDRNAVWRFSMEPEAPKEKEEKKEEEQKQDSLESWFSTNRLIITKLQMEAEDQNKQSFRIPASLFPNEEVKEEVAEWFRDSGEYRFASIFEKTGDLNVILLED